MDCVTTASNPYAASPTNSEPTGEQSITLAPPAFLVDTFTDTANTALNLHTPDTGGAWTEVQGSGNPKIDPSGTLACFNNSESVAVNAATPPSADYTVSGTVHKPSGGFGHAGVMARASSGAFTGYRLVYDGNNDNHTLDKVVAGAVTNLATYAIALADGASEPIILDVNGTTLTATINGAAQTPVTDGAIAGPGLAGVNIFQNALIQPSIQLTHIDAQ